MQRFPAKRHMVIPCFPDEVEFTTEAEVVDDPLFQRTFAIKQNGPNHKIFRGATHSRGEHMMGAYHRTKGLVRRLMNEGMVRQTDEYVLRMYALLHDVGHGPYCHGIETVTSRDHKEIGALRIEALRAKIENVGVPANRLIAMLRKEDPLGMIVSDYNLGTEKIDYLDRDAWHIGKRIADTTKLMRHLAYEGGAVGIGIEAREDAMRMLREYVFMYEVVYLNVECQMFERMLGRMTATLLEHGLSEDALWEMTDGELDGAFAQSERVEVDELYRRFRHAQPPHILAVVRPVGGEAFEREEERKVVKGIDPKLFPDAYEPREAHELAKKVEAEVARAAKIPAWSVLVLPPIERKRFQPKDIPIFDRGRRLSMRHVSPNAFADIEATYAKNVGLRVCVFPEHRDAAWGVRQDALTIAFDALAEHHESRARRS